MKSWEFEELKTAIIEDYETFLRDGFNSGQAAERCFYEFEPVINEGLAESLVVHITIALLLIRDGIISEYHFKKINNVIESFNPDKLINELTSDEIQQLARSIEDIRKAQ